MKQLTDKNNISNEVINQDTFCFGYSYSYYWWWYTTLPDSGSE
ncbi:MAG: hypothetical protein V3V99_14010 [candidate division Zixibacteria bacterium]